MTFERLSKVRGLLLGMAVTVCGACVPDPGTPETLDAGPDATLVPDASTDRADAGDADTADAGLDAGTEPDGGPDVELPPAATLRVEQWRREGEQLHVHYRVDNRGDAPLPALQLKLWRVDGALLEVGGAAPARTVALPALGGGEAISGEAQLELAGLSSVSVHGQLQSADGVVLAAVPPWFWTREVLQYSAPRTALYASAGPALLAAGATRALTAHAQAVHSPSSEVVSVALAHPRPVDLALRLVAPSGAVRELVRKGDLLGLPASTLLTFADDGTRPPGAGASPFASAWSGPVGDRTGNWSLRIEDSGVASQPAGTVEGWTLALRGAPKLEPCQSDFGDPLCPQRCWEHPSCETGLSASRSPQPGFETFSLTAESDHFLLFVGADAQTRQLAAEEPLAVLEHQLECAYRFFVCRHGMARPGASKLHVYVGPGLAASQLGRATRERIHLNPSTMRPPLEGAKLTVQAHELFHVHQLAGFYNSYEFFSEGHAVIAEQSVSTDGYLRSYLRNGRADWLTHPASPSSYRQNLLHRYFIEQLRGPFDATVTRSPGDLFPELQQLTATLAALPPGTKIRPVLDAYVAAARRPRSLATTTEELLRNFTATVWLFRQAPQDPRYRFYWNGVYKQASPFTLAAHHELTRSAPPLALSNATRLYRPNSAFGPGFEQFMTLDYYRLTLGSNVTGIKVVPGQSDDDIRMALIDARSPQDVRVSAVPVHSPSILPVSGATEVVLVLYTVNSSPIYDGGRIYDLSLEAQ